MLHCYFAPSVTRLAAGEDMNTRYVAVATRPFPGTTSRKELFLKQ